ncbi:uncharacterized protein LOC131932816 [Physella acuta]|uniref:uncharacterized protein LOC131932816 n=1 Tax=Physella acuta TaxID=109671 RepID=UPI0027DD32D1|nr:uncharacterized protein LOC131932816 [Physella acuta]
MSFKKNMQNQHKQVNLVPPPPSTPFFSSLRPTLPRSQHRPQLPPRPKKKLSTQPAPTQTVELLLVGKTGHGISATGNSIARRKVFSTSSGFRAEVSKVQELWTELNGYTVHVVDMPGFREAALDGDLNSRNMAEAASKFPNGFHAVGIVLKYGERFTDEFICMMKRVFGESLVKQYGMIIITHGDCFDLNQEDDEVENFSDWVSRQEGSLKRLLIECSYRCILFRNRTKDEKEKHAQVITLLEGVLKLKATETPHTHSHFDNIQNVSDMSMVEKKSPFIKAEIMQQTNLLIEAISRIKITEDNMEEIDNEITVIDGRIKKLYDDIKSNDKETGVLIGLNIEVKKVETMLVNLRESKFTKLKYLMKRKFFEQQNLLKIEQAKREKAEDEKALLEKLKIAGEIDKNTIFKKLQENEQAMRLREEQMLETFKNEMQKIKSEDARRWRKKVEFLQKTQASQLKSIQKHYEDMNKVNNFAIQSEINQLTGKLEEINKTAKPRNQDPMKIELRCRDQQGRVIDLEMGKYDEMVRLMRTFCDSYSMLMHEAKFLIDGKRIQPCDTPTSLELEDGDLIEVFKDQIGGV